jgi:hypothetical protein
MARPQDATSACAGARTILVPSDRAHRHWRHRFGTPISAHSRQAAVRNRHDVRIEGRSPCRDRVAARECDCISAAPSARKSRPMGFAGNCAGGGRDVQTDQGAISQRSVMGVVSQPRTVNFLRVFRGLCARQFRQPSFRVPLSCASLLTERWGRARPSWAPVRPSAGGTGPPTSATQWGVYGTFQ